MADGGPPADTLPEIDPSKDVTSSMPNFLGNRGMKGNLHARKSVLMLHELQDYIKGVEAIAAARKEQLEHIYEEKREAERKDRMLRQNCRSHENDFSMFGNMVDVPTKVRALHEDIKSQKDKVRKYKEKMLLAEKTVVTQQREIHRMEEKMKVLQEALDAVGKTSKQVFDEEKVLASMEEKDKTIEDLEHRLRVVMRSRETDYRKFKQERGSERRAFEALQDEVDVLRAAVEEKDRAIRMGAVRTRSLLKEMEPLRKQVEKLKASNLRMSMEGLGGGVGGSGGAGYSGPGPFLTQTEEMEEAPMDHAGMRVMHNDDHVQLMICVVKDDGLVKGNVIVSKAEKEEAAAVRIQAQFRGFQTRKILKHRAEEEAASRPDSGGSAAAAAAEAEAAAEAAAAEEAAIRIQKIQRGKVARQRVEKMKEEKAAAAAEAKAKKEKEKAAKKKEATPAKGPPKGGRPNAGAKKPAVSTRNRK